MSFEMNSVPISDVCDRKHVKVCHKLFTQFQSGQFIYEKKPSNSGSMLAKLNDTMQAKQY